jgi:thiol:disulfide interchange protein
MDYGKNTDDNYEKGLNIHHVPTIIVYDKNGKEIDRFVEKSRQSFLKDMLKIFQKKDYKDSYEK